MCISVHVCFFAYVCISVHAFISVHVWVYGCFCACVWVSVHVCVCAVVCVLTGHGGEVGFLGEYVPDPQLLQWLLQVHPLLHLEPEATGLRGHTLGHPRPEVSSATILLHV